jgi:hypothetical protein
MCHCVCQLCLLWGGPLSTAQGYVLWQWGETASLRNWVSIRLFILFIYLFLVPREATDRTLLSSGNAASYSGSPGLKSRLRHTIVTNSVAQEPEDSSPHSQQPAIGPCPEPVESNPHPPSQSL